MQHQYLSALESKLRDVGVFFRNQQWKQVFIFLFFLLLSFCFWFLQNLQQDFERRVELPLRYKNVPSEWILSEDKPAKISIFLKDKGTMLMYYFWKTNFSPVDISVSNLSRAGINSLLIPNKVLEEAVTNQLKTSTTISSIEPREVILFYDSLGNRLVPVVADVLIQTKPGFQISDSIRLTPSFVRLYGSNKALEQINSITTKRYSLKNVSDHQEINASLVIPSGIKADPEQVKLSITVEEYTEKRLKLPVLCSDIPSGYALRIFPLNVEIVCNVPMSKFRLLNEEDIEIHLPFQEFEEKQTIGKIPIRLTRKPSWVVIAEIIPKEVEFIIEQTKHD